MKIVAITGGAQGIGRATALAFARVGYAVSIADVADDAGNELCRLVERGGGKAHYVPADNGNARDVSRWISETIAVLGCPDVVINNAGISRRKPFLDLTIEDFDRVLAVNLRGALLVSQGFAREMLARRKGGAIVNIASTRAFMSEPGTEAYSASKGGIVALTHAMAMSLGEHDIRVNCISPGWIETRDWQYSGRAQTPVHSTIDREQHPAGRVGKPDDIANACLFLAESAPFMTGQNIIIDGGMSVKMIYAE